MSRFKLVCQYDGSDFSGWQLQKTKRTVQGELQKALTKLNKGKLVHIIGSGRTDAGVHALGQVAHFEINTELKINQLRKAINGNLNDDCYVDQIELVNDDFHARFSAKERVYKYIIFNQISAPVIEKKRGWHVRKPLDLDLIKKGAKKLVGTHDYSTFRSSSCHAKSPIKSIKSVKVKSSKNKIEIEFKSQSFLQQQVRSMVGCLKYLGEKKWDLKTFNKAFTSKKRILCAPPAPPEGLFLARVIY